MPDYITEIDEPGGGITYIGYAAPNTSFATPQWKIKRMVETVVGTDTQTSITYAGGAANFNQVWNNRATLFYA